jgi:amino acid transporter
VVNDEGKVLLEVVSLGAPGVPIDKIFPFLTVFAVANTALINMLMASRLVYGLARQDVLPRSLGHVLAGRRTPWTAIIFTTLLALGLIIYVTLGEGTSVVEALSGTTGLLLLCVFTIVNIACLVVRRRSDTTPTFRAPAPRHRPGCRCSAPLPRPSWSGRGPATPRTGSSTGSPWCCWPSASRCGR